MQSNIKNVISEDYTVVILGLADYYEMQLQQYSSFLPNKRDMYAVSNTINCGRRLMPLLKENHFLDVELLVKEAHAAKYR